MKCRRCGAASPEGKRFCGDCGAALIESEPRPAHADAGPRVRAPTDSAANEAERRPLTVVFCDLVGSTGLSAKLDPEDLRDVMAVYHRCIADTVARYGGFVAKYMGDGIIVYFGYPHAHEDDAARAVTAALALLEAVATLRPKVITEPLCVRVGIATGDTVVGDLMGAGAAQEQAVVGAAPNLAARLQALADPGTVVISAATRRLTAGRFEYRDLGTVLVKGFPEPIQAWQVIRTSAIESRFEALHADQQVPLLGREQDIDLLLQCWAQAKTGHGRMVLLSGEPGIGKSRIAANLIERLSGERLSLLRFFCSPDRLDSPLYPLLARVERAADLKRDDTEEQKLKKIEALLPSSNDNSAHAALLADLLTISANRPRPTLKLSPEQRKEKTLAALVAQFEALTAQQPVLMLCEDIQWIDPTSRELLDRLAHRVSALPAMILLTFRPGFAPPWAGHPHVISHHLGRLNRDDAGVFIEHLAGRKTLPRKVTRQILERTDGVPLFLEELTKMVLESGLLREERDGFVLDAPLPPLAVPATLRASLVARLDRLSPVKEVAQIAAGIGREFAFDMLAAVCSRPGHELQDALDQLVTSGLIFARDTPPRSTYAFKHALVQDAAYGTMLRSRRRQLHNRVGSALETHFPEIAASQPEIVARHYTEAGVPAKAIGYWLKAGHLAGARSANFEARSHLVKGLELVQRLAPGRERDRQELTFQSLLGPALIATNGHTAPEPMAAYRRALSLIKKTGETAHQDSVFFGLFSIYCNCARFAAALKLVRDFLRMVEQHDETLPRALARGMACGLSNLFGEFASARDHAVQSTSLLESLPHGSSSWRYSTDLGVSGKIQLAISLWHLGFPDQSITLEREMLTAAERLNHLATTALALTYTALAAFRRRDFDELRQSVARLLAHARAYRMTQLSAWGTCLEGAALATADPVQAIERIEVGIALCEKIKNRVFRPIWLTGLAEAQLAAGRPKKALDSVERAFAIADRTRELWMNAELWRLKAQITLQLGRHGARDEAETCLRHAIACADKQQSKMLALRAATSLAELWKQQGLRTRARELLAPHYESFTEGFDTPDLRQAKSLLDALH
jgi:class 3 adenylate cyclase/predicted ATPase